MDKRQELAAKHRERVAERLALEGNSVFTDLRTERDVLLEQKAMLLKALEEAVSLMEYRDLPTDQARAAIRAAKGE